MKTAQILRKYEPNEWGGTESVLLASVKGLQLNDIQSVVFCPKFTTTPNNTPKANGSNGSLDPLLDTGCQFQRYEACVPVWGLSADARKRARAIGGNLFSFDLPGLLQSEPKLDIIHTHTLGRLGGIALTIAERRRIPFVVTIHGGVLDLDSSIARQFKESTSGGIEWGKLFGWWWNARSVLSRADAILTCNSSEAELLRKAFPSKEIIIQPHGIDCAAFNEDHRATAREAFPKIRGRRILISIARVFYVKNQLWLVRQLPEILKRHPDTLVVFAGSCTHQDYRELLDKEVERLGLEDHVLFTGGLPPRDPRLTGLLQAADAMVLPSTAETFGIVFLEAWAAGTPIVTTRTSGALSLIQDKENGFLFNLDEPEVFQSTIDRILDSPESIQPQIKAGLRIVRDNHDTVAISAQIRSLYAKLIEQKKPQGFPLRLPLPVRSAQTEKSLKANF
ncbi:MAG: glycosyltransferase family 4 protein [Opitutales bacterium]|nr:glycosyltransferase family 4 protein [Opitutales bacterium]